MTADTLAAAQSALLDAIAGDPGGGFPATGIEAYRRNRRIHASRALAISCPTVQQLLGEEGFEALVVRALAAHPPEVGDWGEWGAALPAWIDTLPELADWPYLADALRLDLACHQAERALDGAPDPASLARLGSDDPARLRLVLAPGTACIASRFPVGAIHAMHHGPDAAGATVVARAALAGASGETVLVWRQGWRAQVQALAPAEARWWSALLAGESLAAALDAVAHTPFNLAAWLPGAWTRGQVLGLADHGD